MDSKNGRPFGSYKIGSREELQQKIDSYFRACDEHTTRQLVGTGASARFFNVSDPLPYAPTDLASAIGISRRTLNNYMDSEEYGDIIIAARNKIFGQWERALYRLGNNSGVQFAMVNNFSADNRYVQKQEIDLGGQAGNPVEINNTTGLSEDQIRSILEIMGEDSDV